MIIHKNTQSFSANNPVITVGTFDGVHCGHRKVLESLNEIARETEGESVIFTFYPHPRLVVSPDEQNLRLLTTLPEKEEQLQLAGIDHLVVYPFTKAFAALSYRDFVQQILVNQLGVHTLVVGHDHKLGKGREGGYDKLLELSNQSSFKVRRIDALLMDEINVSSSKIREALQAGRVDLANQFLGYTFTLHGTVTEGNQLGRSIGFPTANVLSSDPYKLIPAQGVYAVSVEVEGKIHHGMLNIGSRPTINSNADNRTIEVFIFDFNHNIYEQQITLHFHQRIRDEKKFPSVEELKAQLGIDKETITKYFSRRKII